MSHTHFSLLLLFTYKLSLTFNQFTVFFRAVPKLYCISCGVHFSHTRSTVTQLHSIPEFRSIHCVCVIFCLADQVGTPGRMRALAAAGSLRLDSSALVVLDLEKNIKGRNVLDMDGVSADTMAFLSDCVRPHLVSSSSSSSGSGKKKQKVGGGGGGGKKGAAGEGGRQLRIALY